MCLDHTKDTCIPTTVARRYAWLQQMVMAALDLACTHAFFPMIPPTPPGSWAWLPSGKFLYINFRPNKKIYTWFSKKTCYQLFHTCCATKFLIFSFVCSIPFTALFCFHTLPPLHRKPTWIVYLNKLNLEVCCGWLFSATRFVLAIKSSSR